MRKAPIFRDAVEVTDGDLDDFVDDIKKSDDDIVIDAVLKGRRRFTGMVVTQSSATSVSVGEGRLWFDGARYYSDDPGGVPLDLLPLKPNLQKRRIAIVAWPDEKDDDLEYRDHEVDAENETKVPKQVKVKRFRHARLEAVGGAESVSPQAPVIPGSAVVIATVLMGTGGIEGISRNTSAELDNLGDVADEVDELNEFRESVAPQIATITSEIARITGRLNELGNQELAYALAQDVAEIKERLDLPAAYVAHRFDDFLSDDKSETLAPGYAARTEEGLRFAPDAIAAAQLQIFNPFNPDVIVSGGGLVLPKYTQIPVRQVKGGTGELALTQYGFVDNRNTTLLGMTRNRTRYGKEFEISTGSAFYMTGLYGGGGVQHFGALSVFRIGNETFQQYDTGRVDPDGHKIVRLAQFWADSITSPYWSRADTTDQNIAGYAFVETFVQPRDGWVVELSARVSRKPADGLLHVGLCECDERGEPDLGRMLCLASAGPSHWTPEGGLGFNKLPVEPTFMKGGGRFGYVLMTAADYWVQKVETGTSPTTGTLFYGLNGGVWQSDPNRHIMFDLFFATFERNRVEVDLQALSLPGGMSAIDIITQGIAPEQSTKLTYEIQIGGVWRPLAEAAAVSALATLPPLVPLRAVFTGTPDIMPGLRLSGSQVRVSRPKTVLKHVSKEQTLGASSSTIRSKTRLRNFEAANHTQSTKILVGAGFATVETADSVVDVARPGGVIERTATFNLAAPVTSYKRQVDATTNSATNLFVTDGVTDVAT